MIRLTFHGAAHTVTGSKYLLESGDARLLIDCGLFQGPKELRLRNWQAPGFNPARVAAVALTHAHLDHTGYLPRLHREGFRGAIFGTPATQELTELILLDSAQNQLRDAQYANRKGFSKHHPAQPLYDARDVQHTLKLFRRAARDKWFCPVEPFWLKYHDVGHLLGASLIELEVRDRTPPLRIVFSGDVGRYDAPIYHDPQPPPPCDYLICESTYGDRDHPPGVPLDQLCDVVLRAVKRGGVIVAASFAIGRAQQLIYLLQLLLHAGKIPPMPIFLDSPMAVDATYVYRAHRAQHDLSEGELGGRHSVLRDEHVRLASSTEDSRRINSIRGPAVIIASSGMMTGGRILHHLRQRLPDPANTMLLGGFMAEGTRGRQMQDGAATIRIHGQDIPVRAAVESLPWLSGHAGRGELLRWLTPLSPPRRTFLTHGELAAAEAFAATLRERRQFEVCVPALGETVEFE